MSLFEAFGLGILVGIATGIGLSAIVVAGWLVVMARHWVQR